MNTPTVARGDLREALDWFGSVESAAGEAERGNGEPRLTVSAGCGELRLHFAGVPRSGVTRASVTLPASGDMPARNLDVDSLRAVVAAWPRDTVGLGVSACAMSFVTLSAPDCTVSLASYPPTPTERDDVATAAPPETMSARVLHDALADAALGAWGDVPHRSWQQQPQLHGVRLGDGSAVVTDGARLALVHLRGHLLDVPPVTLPMNLVGPLRAMLVRSVEREDYRPPPPEGTTIRGPVGEVDVQASDVWTFTAANYSLAVAPLTLPFPGWRACIPGGAPSASAVVKRRQLHDAAALVASLGDAAARLTIGGDAVSLSACYGGSEAGARVTPGSNSGEMRVNVDARYLRDALASLRCVDVAVELRRHVDGSWSPIVIRPADGHLQNEGVRLIMPVAGDA